MAQNKDSKPDVINDYSCYINIYNATKYTLGLLDRGANEGVWPKGQPPNSISPGSTTQVWLKDKAGPSGTDGWVQYEALGIDDVSFKLQFGDPYSGWSDNWLNVQLSNPQFISVAIQPYQKSGHPFTGNASIYVTKQSITQEVHGNEGREHVNFDIGFDAPGTILDKAPLHETLAIAAFINAKAPVTMAKGTTYHNLDSKQWEWFRGILWNDDPECLLFDDDQNNNHNPSLGLEFLAHFKGNDPKCMTRRSHFGDLQFLHAMANQVGEPPQVTRNRLVGWFEVMYKLACGNQGIAEGDKLRDRLPNYFNGSTTPPGDRSLCDLFLATTANYYMPDIPKRALGSCLHMIEDSYAIGHTQRRLKNCHDLEGRDQSGHIRFKSGTYGDWGPIKVFHTYKGQDSHRHGFYDGLEGKPLPSPKDLSSFNAILGGRNAIDACKKLLDFYAQKVPWESGVRDLVMNTIFALDPEAQPSNTSVDDSISCPSQSTSHATFETTQFDYEAGLQRKLATLESGVVTSEERKKPLWKRISLYSMGASLLLLSAAAMLMHGVMLLKSHSK